MLRQSIIVVLCCLTVLTVFAVVADQADAQTPQAYNRQWGQTYSTQDWNKFYYYPYVTYPHNYYSPDYYKSSQSLYYRYPAEMRIPVYSKQWLNYYPNPRRYHSGHHFLLDVF